MRKLENLEYVTREVSHMGCIEGCLKYLGIDVSPGWLYGGTGHAFIMSLGEDLCPSGPHCWKWGEVNKLGKNLGYDYSAIFATKSDENFSQKQKEAWDFVHKSIDDGFPCYGWHYEFLIIHGYDDTGYLLSGPLEAPGDWRKFGAEAIGFIDIWSLKPGEKADDKTTIKDSLSFALDYAKSYEKWALPGYKGGLDAYDSWISGLESGEVSAIGPGYHAAVWSECRGFAVEFFEEANQRTKKKFDGLFQPAINHYKVVRDNLQEVENLFPFKNTTDEEKKKNVENKEQRQKAIAHVKAAKIAEAAGLKSLEKILETV